LVDMFAGDVLSFILDSGGSSGGHLYLTQVDHT
jgi:hypothetical protein